MFEDMTWWNEPPEWSADGDELRAVTGERTDGLEVTGGSVHVSTVLTRDFSDVSMADLTPGPHPEIAMRVSRFGEALAVHCRTGGEPWQLLRLGYLDLPATVDVGVMCCSPSRAGLEATFRDFRVGPPMSREGLE